MLDAYLAEVGEGAGNGGASGEVGPDLAGRHVEQTRAVAVEAVHAVAGVILTPPGQVSIVSRAQGVRGRNEAQRLQASVLDLLLELERQLPAHEVNEHLKIVLLLGSGC